MVRRSAAVVAVAAVGLGAAPAVTAAPATSSGFRTATGCTSSGTRVIDNGSRAGRAVALTFDDGPSRFTGRILSQLRAAGAKATFFPQANQITRARQTSVRQLRAAGMEIGNHTFTHADLGNGGPAATNEMRQATERIRAVTGFTPCLFRPPFRSVGNDLPARARRLGMSTVNGDVDPSDWETPGTSTIVSRVLQRTRNGSIVVLHDGGDNGGADRSQTVAALPTILRTLKSRGYRLVTVSELLGYRPRR